jgi:hypothetical protein
MRYLRYLALLSVLIVPAAFAHGQVSVGIGVGYPGYYAAGPPVCQWGYYDYYPYACAPYGFYGPQWFSGGVFIGAGPWYHSYYGRGFYGRAGWGYGRGFYGRRDWDGRGQWNGRSAWNGRGVNGGRNMNARGFAGRGNVAGGGDRGGFHGNGGFARGGGGGGFHGGGGGGFHGGGRR